MNRLFPVVCFVVGLSLQAGAQPPSMAQTKSWLEAEAIPLLRGQIRFTGGTATNVTVISLSLNECVLSWTEQHTSREGSEERLIVTLPLKTVDSGGIVVKPADDVLPRSDHVLVPIRKSAGRAVTTQYAGKPAETQDATMMIVSDVTSGQRIANALKRAVELCGGASPF